MWFYSLAIRRSRDIEENPGRTPNSSECLSICNWNLNSISAHNFIKLSLLRAYISINKIDIIYLSESYFDSSISSENDNLELPEYNLVAQIILLTSKEAMFAFIIIISYT